MNKYILHNSELLREETFSLTINNRAFLYADGFFETIKVINSRCFNLDIHFRRVVRTAEYLKIDIEFSFLEFKLLLDKPYRRAN